jgi:hypothetical protein
MALPESAHRHAAFAGKVTAEIIACFAPAGRPDSWKHTTASENQP